MDTVTLVCNETTLYFVQNFNTCTDMTIHFQTNFFNILKHFYNSKIIAKKMVLNKSNKYKLMIIKEWINITYLKCNWQI